MKKKILPKIVSFTRLNSTKGNLIGLIFSILVICFTIAFYALGWTGPKAPPPIGNVDPPVNVGPTGQWKTGILRVAGLTADGETHLAWESGNVGIGTTSPGEKLDVDGNIVASGTICDKGGSNCIGAGGGALGNWESKSSNTNYYAATDGFVLCTSGVQSAWISGFTDGNNPPGTRRISTSISPAAGEIHSFTMPVKEGDYWRVENCNVSIYWIPF